MQEHELIQQIRRGDRDAFRLLVEAYEDKVYNTVYGFLHQVDDTLDVTQDVFVEVYRSIDRFRGDSSVSTWIYRIAVTRALNFLKRRKKLKGVVRVLDAENGSKQQPDIQIAEPSQNPEEKIQNRELGEQIERAMDALPERQRAAFVLHKLEDLSYKEIAEVLKTSVSSVESLIHRAKIGLQEHLIRQWKE